MNQAQPQNLDKALEHLTLCLEDPCVPGELEGWTKAVWQALEGVRPVLQNHFAVNHQEHFARITEEDSEMFRQVTLLKKEDRNILQSPWRTLPKTGNCHSYLASRSFSA